MKKFLLLIIILLAGSALLSFTGCTAGAKEKARDKANMEDTYRNAADFEKAQDRQRLDHGGY